jgi:predicted metal-dependent hydrolase
MDQTQTPIIVAFSKDAGFIASLQRSADQAGCRLFCIQDAREFEASESLQIERGISEPLRGSEARLIEKLSAWRPVLIVIGLDNPAIPWQKWIALIKSVPATRRRPLICVSASLSADECQIAMELGAEGVYPKVEEDQVISAWITKHAHFMDYAALEESCLQPLSELAVRGLQLFNQGEYFEAHEILEEAWNQDCTPSREMYRAILQIAVAYLQIERGNYQGAVKMFLRVRQWIQPLPDLCRGVDIAQLRQDSQKVYDQLILLGNEHITSMDRKLFKPVKYQV